MKLSSESFAFEAGDEVLFENSAGRFAPVIIVRRLYDSDKPHYMIRHWNDPTDGVPCCQSWLRPCIIPQEALRRMMMNNSPPINVHADASPRHSQSR